MDKGKISYTKYCPSTFVFANIFLTIYKNIQVKT